MAIATRDMSIFYDLKQGELDMVSNYAASLIRNRVQHIEDYYKFQKMRDRMLAKKTMSDEEQTTTQRKLHGRSMKKSQLRKSRPGNLFEIRFGMFADRADEIIRQFLADVFVAANPAAPDGLPVRGLSNGFWFGLDVFLIIGIRHRRRIGKNFHVSHAGDEQRMCSQINGLLHLSRNVGICPLGNVQGAVRRFFAIRKIHKLVHVPSGLKTEMLEQRKIRILADNGYREFAGIFDHIMCVVCLVDRKRDAVRICCHLPGGVGDASVVLPVPLRCHDKEAVGQLKHSFCVHKVPPFM